MPSRALCRLPERREDRAEVLRILGDVVVELEREAVLLERANPLMRGDEHVRPFADAEHLQELQRVVVEALRRAFAHHDLDALVGAFRLELLVQQVGRLDDVAGAQRSRRVLARPEFELDGLLRSAGALSNDGARRQGAPRRQRRSSASPSGSFGLPP